MPCRAPDFWWKKPGLAAAALRPAAAVYGAIAASRRNAANPYRADVPVICAGNIVAGGAGKTPAVQALMALMFDAGLTKYPSILLRGYGGRLAGPTTVDPERHHYKDVGDESLLHATAAPTIIARDRAAGVKLAQLSGADCVFMDDGLQNPSVAKTLSFLVIDAAQGVGNGLTLPAGPLREPLGEALEKTDAIILIGGELPFETDKPVFRARIIPSVAVSAGAKMVAFAGLGRPEKFRHTLEQSGASLAGWHAFPDHHAYKDREIEKLIRIAADAGATLITTEKDYVRVPEKFRDRLAYLPVTMTFDTPQAMTNFVRERLAAR